MKITIECNEDQVQVIKDSLDFFSRILMGQFREIDNLFMRYVDLHLMDNRILIDKYATYIRDIIYPELKGYDSWGIYNKNCPEDSKIAFDILQVLRNELVKKRDPEQKNGWNVDWKSPLEASKLPLVKIEVND